MTTSDPAEHRLDRPSERGEDRRWNRERRGELCARIAGGCGHAQRLEIEAHVAGHELGRDALKEKCAAAHGAIPDVTGRGAGALLGGRRVVANRFIDEPRDGLVQRTRTALPAPPPAVRGNTTAIAFACFPSLIVRPSPPSGSESNSSPDGCWVLVEEARQLRVVLGGPLLVELRERGAARLLLLRPVVVIEAIVLVLQRL